MSVELREGVGRVNTDPRISRRRKAVARSKRKRWLLGVAILAALAAIGWAMFWSPLLDVREIKVLGAEFTTEDEVAEAAGLLKTEQNLLLLPTSEVVAKVEALPWVKSAEVDRMLPGTVRVRIVERTPMMVLALGAARWTIDAHGNVLSSGDAVDGLPVLAGVEVGDISPGLRLLTQEALAALKAYRSMPSSLSDDIVGVFAPTIERISFSLANGTTVRYGAAEMLDAKNTVLKVLLARIQAEGRGATYIDVRVPTSPAVSDKPVDSSADGEAEVGPET